MNKHVAPAGPEPIAVDILGTPVAALGWDDAIAYLSGLVANNCFTRISFLNAHNANLAAANPEFAKAISHFLILPDGVGVDMASKALYGHPFPANLNGTDFIPAFLTANETPLKVGLLGTTRDNINAAAVKLAAIAPQHEYSVVSDGFFSMAREAGLLKELEALKPDVLLVAMGVPRQEMWILQKLTRDHCILPIGVGALLDFLSGAIPRAPLWLRRLRLEWLYRLYQEPGRLWRRYVVGNPVFLYRIAREKLRRRFIHD